MNANRTARLVAEANTPVYTTVTKAREHYMAIEIDSGIGRYWRKVKESQVDEYIANLAPSYSISDLDHSAQCWCFA